MNSTIKTIAQLQEAITSTYIYGVVLSILFVLLLIIVANMIQWQPGKFDKSGGKRRSAFFVLLALSLITPLAVNYFLFYSNISVAQFRSSYMMHMGIAAIATAVLYFVISFVLIKMQKRDSKLASIFPKQN